MWRDEVVIWVSRPDLVVGGHLSAFGRVLNDEERAKAMRFHFPEDRRSYVCAHALTRCALEAASGTPAQDFTFRIDRYGKPEISEELEQGRLRFNLSHSRGLVCCAITWQRDVGIDVERVTRNADIDGLAGQVFAVDELAFLRQLEDCARRDAFFAIWTVKEAYTKAVGRGLSIPLDGFSVCLDPPSLVIGQSLLGDPEAGKGEDWQVRLSQPIPGYTFAVAVRAGPSRRVLFRFHEVTPDALAAQCCEPKGLHGALIEPVLT